MKFFLFPVEYNQTILKTEHVNILPKCKIRALQLLFLVTGELLCCHSNAEGSTFSHSTSLMWRSLGHRVVRRLDRLKKLLHVGRKSQSVDARYLVWGRSWGILRKRHKILALSFPLTFIMGCSQREDAGLVGPLEWPSWFIFMFFWLRLLLEQSLFGKDNISHLFMYFLFVQRDHWDFQRGFAGLFFTIPVE